MMNMKEVREHARKLGLKTGRTSKIELVRAIQYQEGSFDCFATAYDETCDQAQCLWRTECFVQARACRLD